LKSYVADVVVAARNLAAVEVDPKWVVHLHFRVVMRHDLAQANLRLGNG
jgi:hypothetical protein